MQRRRITIHLQKVLGVLAGIPDGATGYQIAVRAGLDKATVYRMIARLVEDGWAESNAQPGPSAASPDRNIITMTPLGHDKASEINRRAPYASQHVTRG